MFRVLVIATGIASAASIAVPAAAQQRLDSGSALTAPVPGRTQAPERPSASGWTVFGIELGFFTGGALSMTGALLASEALARDPSDDHGYGPLLALGVLTVTGGATVGSGLGFNRLARDNRWDPHAGWGAAGVLPGMMEGLALAGGIALSADPEMALPGRLAATGAGMLLGGATGYAIFRAMSERRGNAGFETLAFWAGFFTGEVAGIMLTADSGTGARDRAGVMLLMTAAGGALGTALIHLILR